MSLNLNRMKQTIPPIDKSWTLFLDRDGVINERIVDGYVMDFNDFVPVPQLFEALRIFNDKFGKIFVVSNQQCIGKGLCTENTVIHLHHQVNDMLLNNKILIDDFLFCPHKASDNCNCRKPKPGLALQAVEKHPSIDFSKSIIVGDMLTDIQFGHQLGMTTVYVGAPNNHQMKEITHLADFIFDNLFDFAQHI